MKSKIVLLIAFFMLTISSIASAAIYDIYVLPVGDGVFTDVTDRGGDWFNVNASPNSASYYFDSTSSMNTTKVTAYTQFSLSSLSLSMNILSATLNIDLISATLDGTNNSGTINHASNSSTANGSASQRINGNEWVGTIMPTTTKGWNSFDVTDYLKNDLANSYGWSSFSYNYDGTYTYYHWRNSGFSFSSAESESPAFLRIVTDDGGSTVPEPASMLLFGLGAVGAFVRKRFF